jgi:hypothetical protein
VIVRDTTRGGKEKNLTSVWKVPRHCPFVLLVNVSTKPVLLTCNFMALGGGVAGELKLNGNRSLKGCIRANILKLPLGGLHVKHVEQSNVELGHKLSICSGTKGNHGRAAMSGLNCPRVDRKEITDRAC